MFSEKEYQDMFTQVKASEELTRRVMTMKSEEKVIRFTRVARAAFAGHCLSVCLR